MINTIILTEVYNPRSLWKLKVTKNMAQIEQVMVMQ